MITGRRRTGRNDGINREADIEGTMRAGVPLGTTAQNLKTPALRKGFAKALKDGAQLFVDSGAYPAYKAKKPIKDFTPVLNAYDFVASVAPAQVSVVAPDVIGNQEESAKMLAKNIGRVKRLIDKGVRVIVPVQAGEMTIKGYLDAAGLDAADVAIGIPSNAEAYNRRKIVAELEEAGANDVHFLGLGAANRDAQDMVAAARRAGVSKITMDSNRIRSKAGRQIIKDRQAESDLTEDWTQEMMADLPEAQEPGAENLPPSYLKEVLIDRYGFDKEIVNLLRSNSVAAAMEGEGTLPANPQGQLFAGSSAGQSPQGRGQHPQSSPRTPQHRRGRPPASHEGWPVPGWTP